MKASNQRPALGKGAAQAAMRTRRRYIEEVVIRERQRSSHSSNWYRATLRGLDRRARVVTLCFCIAAALLAYRAGFVIMSPSYRLHAALISANLGPTSLAPLMEQAVVLNKLGANIENTTISELRRALDHMVRLTDRTTLELEAQYGAWSVLRGQIRNDGTTYNELRAQLDQTQRLQDQEILRLKDALERAQKPSAWSDAWNLTLSFVLGVLASILAAYMWERAPALKKWWRSQAEARFPNP